MDTLGKYIVGHSSIVMQRDGCNSGECPLGNFIADAFVQHYATKEPKAANEWTPASVVLINTGGLRTTIEQGRKSHTIIDHHHHILQILSTSLCHSHNVCRSRIDNSVWEFGRFDYIAGTGYLGCSWIQCCHRMARATICFTENVADIGYVINRKPHCSVKCLVCSLVNVSLLSRQVCEWHSTSPILLAGVFNRSAYYVINAENLHTNRLLKWKSIQWLPYRF